MAPGLRDADLEEVPFEMDESYPLARRVIHAPYVGLTVGSGEAEPAEVAAAQAAFETSLVEEGISVESIRATVWNAGRSASACELLLYVGGGICAIAAGIKQIDDAIPVLRKWWRAIKKTRDKLRARQLTAEALKLACIDDLASRYNQQTAPELDRIIVGAGAAQYGDGTWSLTSPVYIVIPDKEHDRTHLFVVRTDGEVLHHSELPYFHHDLDEFRLGPISSAGAATELQAVPEGERDWDKDK